MNWYKLSQTIETHESKPLTQEFRNALSQYLSLDRAAGEVRGLIYKCELFLSDEAKNTEELEKQRFKYNLNDPRRQRIRDILDYALKGINRLGYVYQPHINKSPEQLKIYQNKYDWKYKSTGERITPPKWVEKELSDEEYIAKYETEIKKEIAKAENYLKELNDKLEEIKNSPDFQNEKENHKLILINSLRKGDYDNNEDFETNISFAKQIHPEATDLFDKAAEEGKESVKRNIKLEEQEYGQHLPEDWDAWGEGYSDEAQFKDENVFNEETRSWQNLNDQQYQNRFFEDDLPRTDQIYQPTVKKLENFINTYLNRPDLLELVKDLTKENYKKIFRALAVALHPDRHPEEQDKYNAAFTEFQAIHNELPKTITASLNNQYKIIFG